MGLKFANSCSWYRHEKRIQTGLLVEIHAVTMKSSPLQDAKIESGEEKPCMTTAAQYDPSSKFPRWPQSPCTCRCHKSSSRTSATSIIKHSFWPLSTCSCHCISRHRRYEVKYQMPQWLSNRALQFVASWDGLQISVSLTLPTVLMASSVWTVFEYLAQDTAIDWLVRNPVSPLDMSYDGESVLEVRMLD